MRDPECRTRLQYSLDIDTSRHGVVLGALEGLSPEAAKSLLHMPTAAATFAHREEWATVFSA